MSRDQDADGVEGSFLPEAAFSPKASPVPISDTPQKGRKPRKNRPNPKKRKYARMRNAEAKTLETVGLYPTDVAELGALIRTTSGSARLRARRSGAVGTGGPSLVLGIPKSISKQIAAWDKPTPTQRVAIKLQERQIKNLQKRAQGLELRLKDQQDLAARKEVQLGIHHAALTQVKGMITCPLCLDVMDDPHVLAPCGHSACLDCLYEYFRRTSCLFTIQGRPAVQVVTGQGERDTNIRQRTKLCFLCRSPVLLRPVPFYLGRELLENLRAARPPGTALRPEKKPRKQKLLHRPAGDLWKLTFLKDSEPRKWFDKEEQVWRCGCGHEIESGRCSGGCEGEFDPPELSLREQRELRENGVVDSRGDDDGDDSEGDDEPDVDDEEERLSFIAYSDEEGEGEGEGNDEEDYDDDEDDEEDDDEGDEVDGVERSKSQQSAGVKKRRVVLDSDSEDSNSAAKPIHVDSDEDGSEGDDSEAISDDFVPRSPPRGGRAMTSRSFPHVISDSDDE